MNFRLEGPFELPYPEVMKITFYLDVLSLWCLYAERSLQRVHETYGPRLEIEWHLAPIRDGEPLGYTREEEAFFYRRGEALTGEPLVADWLSGPTVSTLFANAAVEAARSLGVRDHRARLAVMEAAMVEGRPAWRPEVAAQAVAQATGLSVDDLLQRMDDPEVLASVHRGNQDLRALGVDQRPVFVFENAIPDRAILSGVWAHEPLAALAEAMMRDEDRFLQFNRENPLPK